MEWRARQRAWLFPRHSARRNDRPHADVLYGGQSWVVWDQLRLFVAKTGVATSRAAPIFGETTDGSSRCACMVLSRFCSSNMAKQLRRCDFTREVTGSWPVLERTSWLVTCAVNGMCIIYRRQNWSKASRRRLDATAMLHVSAPYRGVHCMLM